MKEALIRKSYDIARERYAAIGVDTDKAIDCSSTHPSAYIAGKPTTSWASSATTH